MSKRNTIFRVNKQTNYTVIHNSYVKYEKLSWKAKGILTYLLTLPNDWKININDLVKRSTDGINSLRAGIKELQEAGYIRRYPVKDEKGKIVEWAFDVYETPVDENPQVENPQVENRTLLNTNITNNYKELNTNITNKDIVELKPDGVSAIPYKEIVDYLNNRCGTHYRHTTRKTRDLIKARWNEGFTLDDFKTVIDKKAAEWLNDPKMSKYLRPETLFGPKFEGYLNQPVRRTLADINLTPNMDLFD